MAGASRSASGALGEQLFVVERHPVGGLRFDPVPEGPEFGAMEQRLTWAYLAPFVGILDLEATGQLAQLCGDLRPLSGELLRDDERFLVER